MPPASASNSIETSPGHALRARSITSSGASSSCSTREAAGGVTPCFAKRSIKRSVNCAASENVEMTTPVRVFIKVKFAKIVPSPLSFGHLCPQHKGVGWCEHFESLAEALSWRRVLLCSPSDQASLVTVTAASGRKRTSVWQSGFAQLQEQGLSGFYDPVILVDLLSLYSVVLTTELQLG